MLNSLARMLMLKSMKSRFMQCSCGGVMFVEMEVIQERDGSVVDHYVCDDCRRTDTLEVK